MFRSSTLLNLLLVSLVGYTLATDAPTEAVVDNTPAATPTHICYHPPCQPPRPIHSNAASLPDLRKRRLASEPDLIASHDDDIDSPLGGIDDFLPDLLSSSGTEKNLAPLEVLFAGRPSSSSKARPAYID